MSHRDQASRHHLNDPNPEVLVPHGVEAYEGRSELRQQLWEPQVHTELERRQNRR